MAYHIFTLRKLMLTNEMNTTNLKMMKVQFERDDVEQELLELYDELYGYDISDGDVEGFSPEDVRGSAGRDTTSGELNDADKGRIRRAIIEAQQKENRLDQLLKKLETQYTEAQTELKQVESQEAAAIKEAVPHYGGVPQQG